MKRIPAHIDRYPAKMVARLATELIHRYGQDATSILDPFCGSGAILLAAKKEGIRTTGVDINPVAYLLSSVKSHGVDVKKAYDVCVSLVQHASSLRERASIDWTAKHYWFTPSSLVKFENLRAAALPMQLHRTREGRFVLLALSMTVRLCSRADQKSPKPFISKTAISTRAGKHFDPYKVILKTAQELIATHHLEPSSMSSHKVLLQDFAGNNGALLAQEGFSHVMTSPPYINAQDYFRNFKLEAHILAGLLGFRIPELRDKTIGTERGNLTFGLTESVLDSHRQWIPKIARIESSSPRLALTVHAYFFKMDLVFQRIRQALQPRGTFVLVCGDNLIASQHVQTWRILKKVAEKNGFELFDQYSDVIQNRVLPPKRSGHKGLIKKEMVLAFSKL